MRQVFLFGLFLLVLCLFFIFEKRYIPLDQEAKKITVQIKYHDDIIPLELEPYSTLKEALTHVKLKDDVDYQAMNDQTILSHKDLYVIPIKTLQSKVSINTGSCELLSTVNGIGPKTAEAIIAYREEFGLFQKLDEVRNVKGIGPKKFEKMKDYLCL
ncbi:helix-hairpin-helix domain-containing protein [Erysipelothrix urinaevulpis]|uniref:ComEA family DNA-binding protein n=1 Tax=Erysipelothrix urinaevulpis TaxID=2683717 RepID=UPI0013586B9E|nr:helix-hairpin-helix domain-containing protein [Erysipelothrix urinaevulpis]